MCEEFLFLNLELPRSNIYIWGILIYPNLNDICHWLLHHVASLYISESYMPRFHFFFCETSICICFSPLSFEHNIFAYLFDLWVCLTIFGRILKLLVFTENSFSLYSSTVSQNDVSLPARDAEGRTFPILYPLLCFLMHTLKWLQTVQLSLQLPWTNEVNKICYKNTSWHPTRFQDVANFPSPNVGNDAANTFTGLYWLQWCAGFYKNVRRLS